MLINILGAVTTFIVVLVITLLVWESVVRRKPNYVRKSAPTATTRTVKAVEPAKQYLPVFITRKEIAQRTRELNNKNITVIERPAVQIPMSLKWKKHTYAMIYAADDGLLAILALDKKYAEKLAVTHCDLHSPRFPKGQNWYALTINAQTFDSKASVYSVLDEALTFISNSRG